MKSSRVSAAVLVAVAGLACSSGGGGGGNGGDTTAPSIPGGVSASPLSTTGIRVTWGPSSDDTAVTGYRLYRGGAPYHDATATLYDDLGITPGATHCYRVLAYDAAGNESPLSAESCATTPASGFVLTVAKAGSGSGTVSSSPTGISCGGDCTEPYTSGTSVTLTASAASGSTFASWSGCDSPSGATCTMSMTASKTVTATFTATVTNYTLTVAKAGTGSGTVTSSPAGISCGADCTEPYASGTSVTLTASAASGSSFASWSGCTSSSGTSCTVSMTANKAVTATFSLASQTVTLTLTAANMLEYNSLDSTIANKVFQNVYPPVGLNSFWNFAGGAAQAFGSLVKWNTSALAGKTIESATLTVESRSVPVGYYPRNWKIGAVATSWSPTTVTWNSWANFLFYTASWQSFTYPTYSGRVYTINVQGIVQSWASGTWPNNGISILSTDYSLVGNVDSLDAYDFWLPTLTVTYH